MASLGIIGGACIAAAIATAAGGAEDTPRDPTATGLYNDEPVQQPASAPTDVARNIGGFTVSVTRDVFGSLVSAGAIASTSDEDKLIISCGEGRFDFMISSRDYAFGPKPETTSVDILIAGHPVRTVEVRATRKVFSVHDAGPIMDAISDSEASSLRVVSPSPHGRQVAFTFHHAHDAMEAIRRACGKWD